MSRCWRHRALTAVGGGFLLVVLTAAPAAAHAALVSTDPQPGGVFDDAPERVTLTYSEPVEASFGAVRAYDGRGRRLDTGRPSRPAGDSRQVRVDLPALADGSYVVTWRVLSADAHPVQCAFTFQVGPEATADDPEGLAQRLLNAQGGSQTVGVAYAAARFTVFASLALLVGGAVFVAALWSRGRRSFRARVLVWGAWTGAVVATLAGLALEGPYAAGLSLGDAANTDLLRDVFDTRFGRVWTLRLALLLLAIPLLRRVFPGDRPTAEYPLGRSWRVAAVVLATALVATPGLGGHAGSGDHVPFAVVADALHVGAIAVWLGGLALLVVAVLPRADATELRSVVPRYSRVALACVGVIVVTGAFQSWRQVGGLGPLRDTDFGRLLVFKLLFFGALVVGAAFSREIVNRTFNAKTAGRYARVGAAAGGSASNDEPAELPVLEDATEARNLRRTVAIEVAIAVAILVVASLLVNTPPARSAAAGPFSETLQSDELWVDLVVDPAQVGENDLHVTALLPDGTSTDVLEMQVNLTQTDRDIAPIEVPVRRLSAGHYSAFGFNIPIAGDWQVIVNALIDDTTQVVVKGEVPVR